MHSPHATTRIPTHDLPAQGVPTATSHPVQVPGWGASQNMTVLLPVTASITNRNAAPRANANRSIADGNAKDMTTTRTFLPESLVHTFDSGGRRQLVFGNVGDATDWLHISLPPPIPPHEDTTIAFVISNRAHFVREMLEAVYDLSDCVDGLKMQNQFRPLGNSYFNNLEVEAACHVLLDCLIKLCQTGFRGLRKFNMHTRVRCPDADKTANCFTRYTNTLNALRTWKSICKGVIEEDTKKWQLVNAPLSMIGRKKRDKRGNRLKKDKIDELEARVKDEELPNNSVQARNSADVEDNVALPHVDPMLAVPLHDADSNPGGAMRSRSNGRLPETVPLWLPANKSQVYAPPDTAQPRGRHGDSSLIETAALEADEASSIVTLAWRSGVPTIDQHSGFLEMSYGSIPAYDTPSSSSRPPQNTLLEFDKYYEKLNHLIEQDLEGPTDITAPNAVHQGATAATDQQPCANDDSRHNQQPNAAPFGGVAHYVPARSEDRGRVDASGASSKRRHDEDGACAILPRQRQKTSQHGTRRRGQSFDDGGRKIVGSEAGHVTS